MSLFDKNLLILVDMLIHKGVEGMVCNLVLWFESNLTLAQNLMFTEEVLLFRMLQKKFSRLLLIICSVLIN